MGTWKCPACDSFNPDSVDECLTCGATRRGLKEVIDGAPKEVLVTCPVCRGNNVLNRTMCQWCGAPLPLGPGEGVGDATNPMLQPPAVGQEIGLDDLLAGGDLSTVEDVPMIGDDDGLSLEGDGPTAPSLQTPPALAVGRHSGRAAAPGPVGRSAQGKVSEGQDRGGRETRNCFTCGISLQPDEWVLVAGPRILCRACFHEEFGRNKEQDADAVQAPTSREARADGLSHGTAGRRGWGWLLAGGVLIIAGIVVTAALGFVWGFTPLAGGMVLGGVGLVQWLSAKNPPRPAGDSMSPPDRAGLSS